MRPVTHTIKKQKGSGFGLSYWGRWSGCGKAAHLEAAAEDNAGDSIPSYFQIGSAYHGFKELYYLRGANRPFETSAVQFSDVIDDEWRAEGERLFRYFRANHAPDEWGDILHVEDIFDLENSLELLGIPKYTYQPDLVIKTTRKSVKNLKESRGIELEPNKIYLIDSKTQSSWQGVDVDRFIYSHQRTAYMVAYNHGKPEKEQASGFIHDVILKRKQPEVKTIPNLGYPNENDIKSLKAFLDLCFYNYSNHRDRANPSTYNCFPMTGTCKWFLNGMCNRY